MGLKSPSSHCLKPSNLNLNLAQLRSTISEAETGNGEKSRMRRAGMSMTLLHQFLKSEIMEHSFDLRGMCSQRYQDWDLINKSSDVEQICVCFFRAELPLCSQ